MSLRVTSTGWFGVPGRSPERAKPVVHAVCNKRAICGAKFHRDAEYQWCGHGLHRDMIECQTCLRMVDKQIFQLRKTEALEEFERVADNLSRIEQETGRLKQRTLAAIRAIRAVEAEQNLARSYDARNRETKS